MASLDTLQSTFDGKPTSFGWSSSVPSFTGGTCTLTTPATGGQTCFISLTGSLQGSYAAAQIKSFGVGGGPAGTSGFRANLPFIQERLNANNYVWWGMATSAQLFVGYTVAGVTTFPAATLTYSASTHRWLRIRESGGTTYWEYSSSSSFPLTWTTYYSVANPIAVTDNLAAFQVWRTSSGDPTQSVTIDNVNVLVSVPDSSGMMGMF